MKKTQVVMLAALLSLLMGCSQSEQTDTSQSPITYDQNQDFDSQAFAVYKDVLETKEMIFSNRDDEFMYLDDYISGDYSPPLVWEEMSFTMLDMDGDGTQEFVLKYPIGDKVILHYKDGTVYANEFGGRSMQELKIDGSSGWANGVFHTGYRIYIFDGNTYSFVELGESQIDYHDETEQFQINSVSVTEKEFYAFHMMQHEKEDVVWHQATAENISLHLTGKR